MTSPQGPAEPHQRYAPPPSTPPSHPSTQQTPGQPAVKARRALAIVGVVLAALQVLVTPVMGFVTSAAIIGGAHYSTVGVISGAGTITAGALGLAALGFGIASVLRREQARVLAGAAIGIGAAGIVGVISTGISQLVYSAF